MKKIVFLLLIFFVITGMGGTPEDDSKLVKVVENYRISVTDNEGFTVELTQVTIGESLFLTGTTGKGKHVLNFGNVKNVSIKPIDDKNVEALVQFADGNKFAIVVDGKKKLKGRSKYGVYIITVQDIRQIVFLEKVSPEK